MQQTNLVNLVTERDGVGADKSLEDTAVKVLNGVTREDTVGNKSKDGLGAVLLEDGGSLAESAASVGHIVDKNGDLVLDVTDKNLSHESVFQSNDPTSSELLSYHATNDVGTGALLVDEGETSVKVIGNRGSTRRVSQRELIVLPSNVEILTAWHHRHRERRSRSPQPCSSPECNGGTRAPHTGCRRER